MRSRIDAYVIISDFFKWFLVNSVEDCNISPQMHSTRIKDISFLSGKCMCVANWITNCWIVQQKSFWWMNIYDILKHWTENTIITNNEHLIIEFLKHVNMYIESHLKEGQQKRKFHFNGTKVILFHFECYVMWWSFVKWFYF